MMSIKAIFVTIISIFIAVPSQIKLGFFGVMFIQILFLGLLKVEQKEAVEFEKLQIEEAAPRQELAPVEEE